MTHATFPTTYNLIDYITSQTKLSNLVFLISAYSYLLMLIFLKTSWNSSSPSLNSLNFANVPL